MFLCVLLVLMVVVKCLICCIYNVLVSEQIRILANF